MATTKTADNINVIETKKVVDDMITVHLPLEGENGENFKRVGVNGRMFQIPRGRNVRVPRMVYDVLRQSEKQRGITRAMIDANTDVQRVGL